MRTYSMGTGRPEAQVSLAVISVPSDLLEDDLGPISLRRESLGPGSCSAYFVGSYTRNIQYD